MNVQASASNFSFRHLVKSGSGASQQTDTLPVETGAADEVILSSEQVEQAPKGTSQKAAALRGSANVVATLVAAAIGSPPGFLADLDLANTMFHGSSASFDRVEPRSNTRYGPNGTIRWRGTAIFAAPDPRVALHYTWTRRNGVGTGIDLVNHTSPDQPITFFLYGGASKDDALNRAYGRADDSSGLGHLYFLDKSAFTHEEGLGSMELITRDTDANIGRLDINRRQAIDALVEAGEVNIVWTPE